jgi:hypothetical protein
LETQRVPLGAAVISKPAAAGWLRLDSVWRFHVKQFLAAFRAGIAVLLLSSVPTFAHHGASPYDATKLTTVKGTVSDFQFINPHVELFVDVKDESGKVETWVGEANSPNVLSRHGWSRDVIKKGDQITVIGNRGKNGSKTLRLQKVILPGGQELDPNSLAD